jgi:hypothetical protein
MESGADGGIESRSSWESLLPGCYHFHEKQRIKWYKMGFGKEGYLVNMKRKRVLSYNNE